MRDTEKEGKEKIHGEPSLVLVLKYIKEEPGGCFSKNLRSREENSPKLHHGLNRNRTHGGENVLNFFQCEGFTCFLRLAHTDRDAVPHDRINYLLVAR